LKELRWSTSALRYEVLVSWRGFSETESTWEPAEVIAADVPLLLERLLDRHQDRELVAAVKAHLQQS
jgi:Chromo (CHRromatin Organisation MOdifier) domain